MRLPKQTAQWAVALAALAPCAQDLDAKPNIVLIVTDDQGLWDLGSQGNSEIETPNLDRLAAESVELTRFYVEPVCAPTRAGLMTGRHYLRTGVYNTRFGGDSLDLREVTIAETLGSAGYRTGFVGKWHLGRYRRYHPQHRGFERAIYFTAGHTERYWEPDALLRNGEPVHVRGHITDVLTDAASTFVRSGDGRPFFLLLAYNVPHAPLFVSDALHEKYRTKGLGSRDARIYGLVEQCDAAIGRLLRVIDSEGQRDDTLVLFMSDNGGVSRHFRAGLRGGKASVHEGGVRSPFFARWPGKFEAGRKASARTSHLDLFPTLAEIAGAAPDPLRQLDGQSLLPVLTGESDADTHDRLFHIWDRFAPGVGSRWAVSGPRYKLIGDTLFDLISDPAESQDIATGNRGIVGSMRREFVAWLEDVTAGQTFRPPPVPVGDHLEDPVDLYPSWAQHDGRQASVTQPYHRDPVPPAPLGNRSVDAKTVYTFGAYEWDTIDGWSERGDSARWSIDVAEAGRYTVTLVYGCDIADAGGKFEVRIGSETLRGTVRPTAGRTFFEPHRIGTVRLPTGPSELRVSVVSAPGSDLMALNRVRLGSVQAMGKQSGLRDPR